MMFVMETGNRYRCQNVECRAEFEVTKNSKEGNSNPRCCCGAEMKKLYSKPAFTRIEAEASTLNELFKKSA